MADAACTAFAGKTPPRTWSRALLLTLPIALWSLFMSLRGSCNRSFLADSQRAHRRIPDRAVLHDDEDVQHLSLAKMVFRCVGVLFPIEFIHNVMVLRGSMGIPSKR